MLPRSRWCCLRKKATLSRPVIAHDERNRGAFQARDPCPKFKECAEFGLPSDKSPSVATHPDAHRERPAKQRTLESTGLRPPRQALGIETEQGIPCWCVLVRPRARC